MEEWDQVINEIVFRCKTTSGPYRKSSRSIVNTHDQG